jgi:single-stranded DNA-binding protein
MTWFCSGRLNAREYQDQQGQQRTALELDAEDVQLLGDDPAYAGAGGHAEADAQADDCPF